jgi:hypothetical protein
MTASHKATLLAVLAVLQLAATGSSIYKYETTLRDGTLYRIPTEGFDPADAFRGRYVAVRPTIVMPNPIPAETLDILERIGGGVRAYVVLATDDRGYARAAAITVQPPPQGDYLTIGQAWPRWPQNPQPGTANGPIGYNLVFAFDRYYMNDAAAPQAQQRLTDAIGRNSESRAWLDVRVKNGMGVIEGLLIDGAPIEQVK